MSVRFGKFSNELPATTFHSNPSFATKRKFIRNRAPISIDEDAIDLSAIIAWGRNIPVLHDCLE